MNIDMCKDWVYGQVLPPVVIIGSYLTGNKPGLLLVTTTLPYYTHTVESGLAWFSSTLV